MLMVVDAAHFCDLIVVLVNITWCGVMHVLHVSGKGDATFLVFYMCAVSVE